MDHMPEIALEWHRAGRRAALCTVVETWGSAPRRIGSQLVVSGDGEMMGSVSGGCVEGAVVVEALEAMDVGARRMLQYGVSDGDAFAVGLACGGTIRILVEPVGSTLPENLLSALVDARAERKAIAYMVNVDTGERSLSNDYAKRLRSDRSGFEEDGVTFVGVHNPPLHLICVGAVHIAQALIPMARATGYDCSVIDPRESFASDVRFPGTTLLHDWPDEAVAALGLDARTALVLLTHDPKLDDPALEAGLAAECFYIGALGSRRTHAKRLERMAEAGFTAEQTDRICGPIGLNIGAANPSEIAVSILAEMTQVLRQT
ncbi:MAG: XdhC family protein [Marinovum sp.]|nr:XdhC family protein [Marinovum sp.]